MLVIRSKESIIAMKDAGKNLRGSSMYLRLNLRESETLRSIAGKSASDWDARTIKRLVGLGLIKAYPTSDGSSRLTDQGSEWIGAHVVSV